jgi:hypothetical protein
MVESYFQIPPNSTGSKIRTEQRVVGANTVEMQYVRADEPPTFLAIADRIVPAVNKYILTLFNTLTTRKVVVQRIFVYNWQVAAVTGTLLEYELRKITARTLGATVTPISYDSADTLTSGITADTTSTAVTDVAGAAGLLRRGFSSGEETKFGGLTLENMLSVDDVIACVYDKKDGCKGITLRQNQGISVKCITGTIGSMSVVMLFTDEPV